MCLTNYWCIWVSKVSTDEQLAFSRAPDALNGALSKARMGAVGWCFAFSVRCLAPLSKRSKFLTSLLLNHKWGCSHLCSCGFVQRDVWEHVTLFEETWQVTNIEGFKLLFSLKYFNNQPQLHGTTQVVLVMGYHTRMQGHGCKVVFQLHGHLHHPQGEILQFTCINALYVCQCLAQTPSESVSVSTMSWSACTMTMLIFIQLFGPTMVGPD